MRARIARGNEACQHREEYILPTPARSPARRVGGSEDGKDDEEGKAEGEEGRSESGLLQALRCLQH
eukprot:6060329-Pyramimonas_sp.AAC.1